MTELRVAPGEGRLARRGNALLFVRDDDRAGSLVEAFVESTAGEEYNAITGALIATDFDSAALALVVWHYRLHVTVFGDLELTTDHQALPMLSGASSKTWVEHSLPKSLESIELSIDGGSATEWSNLEAGAVPASGFVLCLSAVEPQVAALPPVKRGVAAVLQPLPVPELVEPTSVVETNLDLLRAPTSIQDAASGFADDSQTPETPIAADPVLVDPAKAVLKLDDDSEIVVNERTIVGRRPDEATGVEALMIHGDKVSREHFLLHRQDDDLFVTDLGSTNGTYVLGAEDDNPVPLKQSVPHLLDIGSTVIFGDRTLTLEST